MCLAVPIMITTNAEKSACSKLGITLRHLVDPHNLNPLALLPWSIVAKSDCKVWLHFSDFIRIHRWWRTIITDEYHRRPISRCIAVDVVFKKKSPNPNRVWETNLNIFSMRVPVILERFRSPLRICRFSQWRKPAQRSYAARIRSGAQDRGRLTAPLGYI